MSRSEPIDKTILAQPIRRTMSDVKRELKNIADSIWEKYADQFAGDLSGDDFAKFLDEYTDAILKRFCVREHGRIEQGYKTDRVAYCIYCGRKFEAAQLCWSECEHGTVCIKPQKHSGEHDSDRHCNACQRKQEER